MRALDFRPRTRQFLCLEERETYFRAGFYFYVPNKQTSFTRVKDARESSSLSEDIELLIERIKNHDLLGSQKEKEFCT